MQKEYLNEIVMPVLKKIGIPEEVELTYDIPKNLDHGDLSINVAMKSSKIMKKAPRAIAEEIISNLEYNPEFIEKPEIAGPGFINFKFTSKFYDNILKQILQNLEQFGKSDLGKDKRANVEYVSANPTGMLHLGHGRNAAIGDTVANLLEWLSYDVTREYYFNNAGNQMNNLAKSIYARYRQISDPDFPLPTDAYHGEYIKTIAEIVRNEKGDTLTEESPENLALYKDYGEKWCFERIKETLTKLGIKQDVFYNEDSLYKDGKIEDVISIFKDSGLAYEKDGALWMKFTELGLNDDRVIVKATGEPTYRLPDIAYHREKFLKGYDLIVDVFGADHIATVPDVMAGVKALGYDSDKVKILIHQFVTLVENGEVVKMSKRSGKSYTLDDLLEEVGYDVVRFFLIMRSIGTHMEFDLSLAKEQSDKNPVFYLQYAHARICSIFEKAEIDYNADLTNSELELKDENEINLLKKAIVFPDVVYAAGTKLEPHLISEYLKELAAAFHIFYHNCRIIGEDEKTMNTRLTLLQLAKHILASGLKIMGISVPERM